MIVIVIAASLATGERGKTGPLQPYTSAITIRRTSLISFGTEYSRKDVAGFFFIIIYYFHVTNSVKSKILFSKNNYLWQCIFSL